MVVIGGLGSVQGALLGALIVGIFTIVIASLALRVIDETYGRDLNFEEED